MGERQEIVTLYVINHVTKLFGVQTFYALFNRLPSHQTKYIFEGVMWQHFLR
jgi:hypothetical protein